MSSNATIHLNTNTIQALRKAPDECVYRIARQTLDMVGSLKATAYKTGETERSMYAKGVQEDAEGYFIGNFTSYAHRVYTLGEKTNWTNPQTRPHWFHSVWKEYGDMITQNCIKQYMGVL